jgi:two-component system phosphate regulon sensor histidine kinase PhoR
MKVADLQQLADLVARERKPLLDAWRAQVRQLPSAAHMDTPTLNDHIPALIDELIVALRRVSDQTIAEAMLQGSPPDHGLQRQHEGFDIVEVVAEYNILRGCIHDLAAGAGLVLQGKAFHILNRVLDEAIGLAVQTFATQQAQELQRRREEYLAFVAHDLRTPLNAISLAARVLENTQLTSNPAPQVAQMHRTLHRNVENLQQLVDAVLKESDHVRTEGGVKLERRFFDLWPLVQSLIQDLNPVAGTASTTLTNEIPVELVAYADASLVRRIFQNLVANAIRYTPRGQVVIGARELDGGEAVECWVRDNGSGIPADRVDVIFDKLESDPGRNESTGLGLAIVKTFVEAHGGEVTVESQEGIGSTFTFRLPRSARTAGRNG